MNNEWNFSLENREHSWKEMRKDLNVYQDFGSQELIDPLKEKEKKPQTEWNSLDSQTQLSPDDWEKLVEEFMISFNSSKSDINFEPQTFKKRKKIFDESSLVLKERLT